MIAGNREQAFVHALSSACLVHSVAKACSSGQSSKCQCGGAPRASDDGAHLLPAGYRWGGCADDVDYASGFAQRFTDGVPKRRRANRRAAANLHNNVAGRTVNIRRLNHQHQLSLPSLRGR